MICSFQSINFEKTLYKLIERLCGYYSKEDTPVPIPNTEVKLFSVENTWLETARKDRELPSQR